MGSNLDLSAMQGEAEMPVPGAAIEVAAGLRRILAPNPGPMTYWGTNTYLIGADPVAVVDPGPFDVRHQDAIVRAVGGASVVAVLVTHAHRDHTDLAPALAQALSAPVIGFGPPDAGQTPRMAELRQAGLVGGGEGVDAGFQPDQTIGDGEILQIGKIPVRALHTPGHFAGHLAFQVGQSILTGDLVMGWSTTLISPPDGDVRAFMKTAGRLRALGAARFFPGHGPVVRDPARRLDWLVQHRMDREHQILGALTSGPDTVLGLASKVYHDLEKALLPAAARNTLAHLLDLWDRGLVAPDEDALDTARWRLR